MIPAETLWTFTLAATLLALAPGPDNLFVLTQSAVAGARAGLLVVLGLCTGILVHSAGVALGVAAVVLASPTAFTALKLIGAAYLLYLAHRAFTAPASALGDGAAGLAPAALYRRGVIMNVTNPKVAIFFLALFPQFTDPALGSMAAQIGMLGILFIAVTVAVFGAIALLAGGLRAALLRAPGAQRTLNRIAGLVFVALAVNIAIATR